MKRIDVQINHKLVGTCEAVIRSSSPLFKDIIDPWIEIEGFVPASPSLTDNQKIVLEWLKNEISENDLQYTLWSFTEDVYEKLEIGAGLAPYIEAWEKLKEKQKFEVLAAFAQWGLEQEENPNGIN
ncbi:hypothetical protein ACPTGZ_08090 [Enterococcus faecium]|uniref:hypothetical protein n=1 Tax=Enterococcus faecium TaxID=1352 RepID=UPI003CC58453